MSDIQSSTVSEEGYATTSQVGDYELSIDATGETAPTAQEVLVADYAACFLPAFRVGANQEGVEDLGTVQIDADADLDGDDDVAAVSFDVYVEADVDDGTLTAVVDRAEEICHVHDALREQLHADIETHADAF